MSPKQWRESKGLSLVDAARVLGTDAGSLKKIERGEGVQTRRLAERFAAATDGSVPIIDWLYPLGAPSKLPLTDEVSPAPAAPDAPATSDA